MVAPPRQATITATTADSRDCCFRRSSAVLADPDGGVGGGDSGVDECVIAIIIL